MGVLRYCSSAAPSGSTAGHPPQAGLRPGSISCRCWTEGCRHRSGSPHAARAAHPTQMFPAGAHFCLNATLHGTKHKLRMCRRSPVSHCVAIYSLSTFPARASEVPETELDSVLQGPGLPGTQGCGRKSGWG